MDQQTLVQLVQNLVDGNLSHEDFLEKVRLPPIAEFSNVSLDLDRQQRCGYPEVIYGEGKDVQTLQRITTKLIENGQSVLATRVSKEKADILQETFPEARYNQLARTFRIDERSSQVDADHRSDDQPSYATVAVVTAGSSDLPVAEEARETLDWMGIDVKMIHDVGVAGPHRLPRHLETLNACAAVVVVAGAEGALPSVVGGYVDCTVVGVPTSVGYGANLGGLAALLSMLNSCAANVTVVNIDAGFKGGYVAGLIARKACQVDDQNPGGSTQ